MVNDLLSDCIARIRNGYLRGLEQVKVLNSKLIHEVLKVLKNEGYIKDLKLQEREILVDLSYSEKNEKALKYIKRVSKCSCRKYTTYADIPRKVYNYGLFILSTNKGILTDVQAKKNKVGGEILLEVF